MRFIAFDLETTGFLPGVDRIVELGAVRFINGEVEAIFSTLIDPEMSMPQAASRVNGITDDMLKGKPKIEELLEPFAEFCGDDFLVAHNAAFDTQFLTKDIEKLESKAPAGVILDSLPLARKVFPGLANYKLGTLVQHLEIPGSGFHRAEEDASFCGRVFLKIIEKMTGSHMVQPPLENLVAMTGKPESRFPQLTPQPKQLSLL
ncbi:MAG: DNA polymerase III subunit epsilon [Bdellovibrionaceae bacterium]|nr:DNA polymerase III subunit epsilon [Pseudobdellovibrionaceae bacterium]|tara:strand:- start:21074 stop:21685 length:612 start_codon:yes stop_codon:yes gene_type:complete